MGSLCSDWECNVTTCFKFRAHGWTRTLNCDLFSVKWLFVGIFYHRNRKETKTALIRGHSPKLISWFLLPNGLKVQRHTAIVLDYLCCRELGDTQAAPPLGNLLTTELSFCHPRNQVNNSLLHQLLFVSSKLCAIMLKHLVKLLAYYKYSVHVQIVTISITLIVYAQSICN